ncbi:MAG: DUF1553 domain-containing protein [Verrucomicrobiota bacterium]
MAKLHILSGAKIGQVLELDAERVTVGRAPNNVVRFDEDLVSIYHAVFVRDGAGYRLRDLNSTNQTRVNSRPISEVPLQNGDRLEFGLVEIRYEVASAPASEPISQPPPIIRNAGVARWIGAGVIILAVVVIVLLASRQRHASPPVVNASAPVTDPVAHQVVPVEQPPPVNVPVVHAELMQVEAPPKMVESLMVVKPEPEKTPEPVAMTMESEAQTMTTASETNLPVTPVVPVAPKVIVETPPTVRETRQSTPVPEPVPEPRAIPGAQLTLFESRNVLRAANPIDTLVMNRLKQLGITPANLCSDAVFCRRVFLDVIGTLPTAQEVRDFLDDKNPSKRARLIDRLLERDEFTDYWAMKWCDLLRVKAEFPVNLWPNAVQSYHHWIHTCVKENLPYDKFVRSMLTANGSNFRAPPVNFYRAMQNRDPQGIAQTVALTFMGVRAEKWSSEQRDNLAAFFLQIGFKTTAEWKEEIVFYDQSRATNNLWQTVVLPDGKTTKLPMDRDPREVFADWLITPQNPWFTRNIANRVWSWLLGRGIIHQPDDIRSDNPPSNPELLAYLQRELIERRYDLKHLYRLILNSKTYQLSAIPKSNKPAAEANFAFYPLRRLEAEVLIDALNQITGTTEKYSSAIPEPFTFIPDNQRAIALADASVTSSFLEMFGRSPRATGMESERNNRPTAAQWLHLLNSSHIQRKIEQSQKLLNNARARTSPREIVNTYYLTILSRYPTDDEVKIALGYSHYGTMAERETTVDLAWALLNSYEFLYRH